MQIKKQGSYIQVEGSNIFGPYDAKKNVHRRKRRGQKDLRDQLAVTLGAIEGHKYNLLSGIITPSEFVEKTEWLFREVEDLFKLIPEGLPKE